MGFLDRELQGWSEKRKREPVRIDALCLVTDTLVMARKAHPGQRNSLDALCKRYAIDNSHRDLHGALLDVEILADVYLAMTGGQASLSLEGEGGSGDHSAATGRIRRLAAERPRLPVPLASADEMATHRARLQAIDQASGAGCLWLQDE